MRAKQRGGVRDKPEHADFYRWDAFTRWADANGVGEDRDDWEAWWECWKAAYSIGQQ